jgi:hypothetical protein
MTHAELQKILEENRQEMEAAILKIMQEKLQALPFPDMLNIFDIAECYGQEMQEDLEEMYEEIYHTLEYTL